ncbi:AEC family transporter [Crocinitomicaceae bacterium CZZ-1]|uniref:AEC family transporter n=1 Tax=Taishania pollutisoli TaxID=2766479 RepID=A0A8J6P4F2_9FLAO|nr:AEC family transporter [Taishania pollutisoli]MBC9811402.1 AEC family transporter [Taishania pollutisoli]
MTSIILLFLCLFIGIGIRYLKAFPANTHTTLNQFIIHISLPAMALFYLPKIEFSSDLIYPVAMPWIAFAMAFILFAGLGKLFGWSKSLIGCLILTGGLGNTSFVGIPVIEAVYGEKGLETLIMIDLPGTFVVLSTLGILVATIYSRGTNDFSVIFKKIFTFPPFIVFLIGIVLNVLDIRFPDYLDDVFYKLSATITPIALVSVGFQLKINKRSKHWRFLFLGLAYQLVLLPVFIYVLYVILLKQEGLAIDVCIMEAAMAPMITASIIAASYGLKPRLSNMMVGIGIPVSFITLTMWYFILSW